MSQQLSPIDLTTAFIGQGFKSYAWDSQVSQSSRQGTMQHPPTLELHNQSGFGVAVVLNTGEQFFLDPGARLPIPLRTGADSLVYQPQTSAFTSGTQKIIPVYFFPYEQPPPGGQQFPPFAGTAASITNQGNPPGQSLIFAQPNDDGAPDVNVKNDGSGSWNILDAGAQRGVMGITRGDHAATHAVVTFGDPADPAMCTFYGSLQGNRPAAVSTISQGDQRTLSNGAADTPHDVWQDTVHNTQVLVNLFNEYWRVVTSYRGGGFVEAIRVWASDGHTEITGNLVPDANVYMQANKNLNFGGLFGILSAAAFIGGGSFFGTENEMTIVCGGQNLSIMDDVSMYLKIDNYFDGTTDRIYTANGQAVQVRYDHLGLYERFAANSGPAGTAITWQAFNQIPQQAFFSGSGAGTFTHGLASGPAWVGITMNVVNSTMTVGIDSRSSTTVHVNVGLAGAAWLGVSEG